MMENDHQGADNQHTRQQLPEPQLSQHEDLLSTTEVASGVTTDPASESFENTTEQDSEPDIHKPEYVVGVGASAGGLEALEALFSHMPFQTGMAFVLIQHLSPDYKSMMDELLARKTSIPIMVAENDMQIKRDTIYLLPPKKEMILSTDKLLLTERENSDVVNLPINTFMRSLAESREESSIGIILSGTGSDGSKGISIVHDKGGFVIAQEPDSCKFDSMPQNAMKTGKVDLVLLPEQMPDALVRYLKRTKKVIQHIDNEGIDREEGRFTEIIILLNNRFGLDFSQYKPSTITRRMERRLTIQQVTSVQDYIDLLLSNQDEMEALYFDLLIGVTQFYRDKKAFYSLRQCLPRLLNDFADEQELRIWVVACATGQEAYSLSMLLHDYLTANPIVDKKTGEMQVKPYKIFATDIHRHSINHAAAGIYSSEDLSGLSEEFQQRYFTSCKKGYRQVVSNIRKPIIFAPHNILVDPPFTRTHLVSCRNLLIYFNQSTQQRVLSLLSFSLKTNGVLFLGPSESLGSHRSDFSSIDDTHKIQRKIRDTSRTGQLTLSSSQVRAGGNKPIRSREPVTASSLKSKQALESLLQQYVPPSILIDSTGLMLHVFGDVGKFLKLEAGNVNLNLRNQLSGAGRVTISQMLGQIAKTAKPLTCRAVTGCGEFAKVDINMRSLSDSPGDLEYILVSFSQSESPTIIKDDKQAKHGHETVMLASSDSARIRELEEELQFNKENLQTTVEELETSNEELQASNEELMSSNEELQSTNEELQSVNEELLTVNGEYQVKQREHNELAADERSIIESSGIGILFLDKDLKIRKYSKSAAKLFNLIETDYGRPFTAFANKVVQDIDNDIQQVLNDGGYVEREVEDYEQSVYRLCIHPHYNIHAPEEEQYGGVILTLTDISSYYFLKINLEKSEQRLQNTLNTLADGYFEWQIDSQGVFFSQGVWDKLGYSLDQQPDFPQLLGEQWPQFASQAQTAQQQRQPLDAIIALRRTDQSLCWMICKAGFNADSKQQQSTTLVGVLIDYNQHKALENQLQYQARKLARSNQLLEQFAYIVSHDMKAPLRHIQNYLGFLREAIRHNDKSAIDKEMQGLADNSNQLEQLIDDIITYSRVNSEHRKEEKVSLQQVLDDVVDILQPYIEEKHAEVHYQALPTLDGDANLLTHMFQNLLENACKYNDKPQPHVDIQCQTEGENCVIKVQDNGIGFDQNFQDVIFSPFKRLVTKQQYPGSGVGLAICQTVAQQHGGTIEARSQPGEGATFIITLPIQQSQQQDQYHA